MHVIYISPLNIFVSCRICWNTVLIMNILYRPPEFPIGRHFLFSCSSPSQQSKSPTGRRYRPGEETLSKPIALLISSLLSLNLFLFGLVCFFISISVSSFPVSLSLSLFPIIRSICAFLSFPSPPLSFSPFFIFAYTSFSSSLRYSLSISIYALYISRCKCHSYRSAFLRLNFSVRFFKPSSSLGIALSYIHTNTPNPSFYSLYRLCPTLLQSKFFLLSK